MIWLIEYLKRLGCEHDFHYEETYVTGDIKSGIKIYRICHKCHYHTNYWKFH